MDKKDGFGTKDGVVVLLLILFVLLSLLNTTEESSGPLVLTRRPTGVMGTESLLTVVVDRQEADLGERALDAAEDALRRIEALTSMYLDDSEISTLNRADAGRRIELSPETAVVLMAARNCTKKSGGAFDATCGPLVRLWKHCGSESQLPTDNEIGVARHQSGWSRFELHPTYAVKTMGGASIDLGGIAKGFAVDQAVEAMSSTGVRGGMVNVGGDLRCFGLGPGGSGWEVAIQSPFDDGVLGSIHIDAGAIATSGNYFRFSEIAGQRYSHILDPRSGFPSDAAPSVTVLSGTAMEADIWATALSVTGAEGLAWLPHCPEVEALLILGEPDDWSIRSTPRFPDVKLNPGN